MTHEGMCYKQLNDLITSYGSTTLIPAYEESHSEASCQFRENVLYCGGLIRLLLRGWKVVKFEDKLTIAYYKGHFGRTDSHGRPIKTVMHCIWKWRSHYAAITLISAILHYQNTNCSITLKDCSSKLWHRIIFQGLLWGSFVGWKANLMVSFRLTVLWEASMTSRPPWKTTFEWWDPWHKVKLCMKQAISHVQNVLE